MALYIIFDTNYLRSMPSGDYLKGEVPERLASQLDTAFERGDIVAVPKTVQTEINAWVREIAETEINSLRQASSLLTSKGFTVTPELDDQPDDVDVLEVLKKKFPDIYSLEPRIEDYMEAERRASFKLPPLPKKPDAEEFRDRVIWSQALNVASKNEFPVVIISNDKIFENGANSKEGMEANIKVAKTEEEFNQYLDQRAPAIQKIVDDILLFSIQLQEKGLKIRDESIERIEDYRAQKDSHGAVIKKFTIAFREGMKLPPKVRGDGRRWGSDQVKCLLLNE